MEDIGISLYNFLKDDAPIVPLKQTLGTNIDKINIVLCTLYNLDLNKIMVIDKISQLYHISPLITIKKHLELIDFEKIILANRTNVLEIIIKCEQDVEITCLILKQLVRLKKKNLFQQLYSLCPNEIGYCFLNSYFSKTEIDTLGSYLNDSMELD